MKSFMIIMNKKSEPVKNKLSNIAAQLPFDSRLVSMHELGYLACMRINFILPFLAKGLIGLSHFDLEIYKL